MRCKFSKLNICRLVAVAIAVTLAAALFAPCVFAASSGSCGSGVNWQFADGTLTVSGSGAMSNYSETRPAPWADIKSSIRVINIGSGVTSVGNNAFRDCEALVSVNFADSVSSIGTSAFANCIKLSILSFGKGLSTIGESAFESCSSLQNVKIPNGVRSLGRKAFYRCDALRSVSVPQSVTSMGSMVFARCNGLVSAEVRASVSALPIWMFYGCDVLSNVTVSASVKTLESKVFHLCNNLKDIYYLGTPIDGMGVLRYVQEQLPEFPSTGMHYSQNTSGSAQVTESYVDNDQTVVSQTVTVKDSQNASVSTTVKTSVQLDESGQSMQPDSIKTTVSVEAVVENKDGWSEVVDQIQQATADAAANSVPKIQVSVSCNSGNTIEGDTLSELSGKNVNMTVNMNDGSSVKIDCSRLDGSNMSGSYQMSYSLTENANPTETLGDADSYVLKFEDNTEFDFSPQIYVGNDRTHSCATLYQVIDGELTEVQSSIIDKNGNATFYLESAYKNSEYVVAIDAPGVDRSTAIVPEDLMVDYGITDEFEQIVIYAPTQDREFLGMNIAQFSFALFGGLALLVVVFGVVMGVFYRKKRLEMMYRLKMQEQAEQE